MLRNFLSAICFGAVFFLVAVLLRGIASPQDVGYTKYPREEFVATFLAFGILVGTVFNNDKSVFAKLCYATTVGFLSFVFGVWAHKYFTPMDMHLTAFPVQEDMALYTTLGFWIGLEVMTRARSKVRAELDAQSTPANSGTTTTNVTPNATPPADAVGSDTKSRTGDDVRVDKQSGGKS